MSISITVPPICCARLGACDCNIFAHRSAKLVIVEVERAAQDTYNPSLDCHFHFRGAIARLQTTTGLQLFFDEAVTQIRSLTVFERVVAYEFQEDGS